MSKGKRISDKEIEYVKVNLMIKSISAIAEDLGRNYYTIYNIAKELGVSRNHEFTPQEDAYIANNYKKMSVAQLAAKLKMSTEMVYNRARKLGIKKNVTKKNITNNY